MKTQEAIDRLDPIAWRDTSAQDKLDLLRQLQDNLWEQVEDLAVTDNQSKGYPVENGSYGYLFGLGYQGTSALMGGVIAGIVELYESLVKGEMLRPLAQHDNGDGTWDVQVFPRSAQDRIMFPDRQDWLRVRGRPTQEIPTTRPGGIIGILGAGNYSSSIEMVKALFLENCVVVHKPHELNQETDHVWEKVFAPLVERKALSFLDASESRALTADDRLTKLYFTGGAETARAIMEATDTPLLSECGGNNPCIIVPGDRPWTDKEIAHQALHIATMAKVNGGAVCGRPQTLVTSRRWPQRKAFLDALEKALLEDTPASKTYYPGSKQVFEAFKDAHPHAKVLLPEGGRIEDAEFLFIPDAGEESYAVKHEAFTQVLDEVALAVPAEPEAFLEAAVAFCNDKLLGTLGSVILVDDDTLEAHRKAVDKAVTDLNYGTVGVNTMPPFAFMSPWLIWGGHEAGGPFVSGRGNFGNTLCLRNAEKSIMFSSFVSPGHMLSTNKKAWLHFSRRAAYHAAHPSWFEFARLMGTALREQVRKKDF